MILTLAIGRRRKLRFQELSDFSKIDLVILAVKHKCYTSMNYLSILKKNKNIVIFDCNGVLTKKKLLALREKDLVS